MLDSLIVKNVALISDAQIEFDKGLNVLTGETGAGKSILVDSIGLLLGARNDKTLIRSGETECKVVGKFSIESNIAGLIDGFCEKYDLEKCDELLISRSFNLDGKSQIKINGQTSTLAMLKELSAILVDCYGQNESFVIFDTANHLKILDAFAGLQREDVFVEYQANNKVLKEINSKIKEFGGSDEERLRNIDLLSYQIKEIEDAKISQQEYEELENKKKFFMNVGKIVANTQEAYNFLAENSVDAVSHARQNLELASNYDNSLAGYAERLNAVKIELNDILSDLEDYNSNSQFDENEQNRVEEKLNLYFSFFRKYGKTVEDVLGYYDKIKEECARLINAKEELLKLQNQKSVVLCKLFSLAKKLHAIRDKKAKELCAQVVDRLKNLGMKNAHLMFRFEELIEDEKYIYADGMDKVELMFSANLGEPEKPLKKIASGGEISRFMLSLKSVIAGVDNLPTMIFDEIDTGISGVISEAVAKQMAIISKNHQVIVITHSQHIASMADNNYLIYKTEQDGKTYTNIKKLNSEEKVKEVARFMSGNDLTQTALLNAKEMIAMQTDFKKSLN
jgi:DNA repair protein RecN (Recombination protein N)